MLQPSFAATRSSAVMLLRTLATVSVMTWLVTTVLSSTVVPLSLKMYNCILQQHLPDYRTLPGYY